jgi:predicted nucleotide-binding protein (sugar kinase/HSP70/actin superfamily)
VYPFGGICNRYYNLRVDKESGNAEELDLVMLRQQLLTGKYGPQPVFQHAASGNTRKTVGLNRTLLFHSLFPLFSNFFSRMGFTVVVPAEIDKEGISRAEAAFCLPVEAAHGGFYRLLTRERCDYIFAPQVMQVPVANVPTYSRLCPFVQGEPYYLKTTFRREIGEAGTVILDPVLRMDAGYESCCAAVTACAAGMGVPEKEARQAWLYACEKQRAFELELRRIGKKALYTLTKNPEMTGIVLFGRPYNAFAEDINMGIPHKIASRGYLVIPHDMLQADDYAVDAKMFWAMGQKLMKAAQFVKDRENLFGVYITNFSCGPDSFLLGYFRSIMGAKPSLTLELDQHTADAGIDTRIEAALDILARHRRMTPETATPARSFVPARVAFPWVWSSQGEKLHITDRRVEVLIPSFGRRASEAVAAILRREGIEARALPVIDKHTLLTGKKNTACKECLPFIVNTGAIVRYLEEEKDPRKVSLFAMATGGGPCRLGQYCRALDRLIGDRGFENAAILTVTDENSYAGLGAGLLLRAWQGIVLTDVLGDIESTLRVCAENPREASEILEALWRKCIAYFSGTLSIRFSSLMRFISEDLARIALRKDPADVPVISLVGEIFVRRDEFSRGILVHYLEKQGCAVRVAPLAEYICYGNYVVNTGLGERKFSLNERIKLKLVSRIQEWWEARIKTILGKSGLYHAEMINVADTIRGVSHLLNENFRGECILTVGLAMREIAHTSCGVVSLGPFGCMYSRMAEAMLNREMDAAGKRRMTGWQAKTLPAEDIGTFPFLSLETDGQPFTQIVEARLEAFVVQARKMHRAMLREKGIEAAFSEETVPEMLNKK